MGLGHLVHRGYTEPRIGSLRPWSWSHTPRTPARLFIGGDRGFLLVYGPTRHPGPAASMSTASTTVQRLAWPGSKYLLFFAFIGLAAGKRQCAKPFYELRRARSVQARTASGRASGS